MLYYFPWLILIVISLSTALGAFIWALGSGQFSDQERARFLPLRDLGGVEKRAPGKPGRLIVAFATVFAMVLVMMAAAVYIALTHS
jgi:cbb3-type cytochrome oxidase maturation protein